MAAVVTFDTGDIDAAFEELDARYLAGEAAAYSQTWSALTRAYAATNAHELPPTTPDWVNIDHRHGPTFAPGEFDEYVRAAWGLAQTGRIYMDEVHRLSEAGAVVTHTAQGTSKEGFDAEWREVMLIAFEHGSVCRCELFDESDVNAALTRFDELSLPTPRLENAASRMYVRFNEHLAARDWDAMAEMIADDVCDDDRRRVVKQRYPTRPGRPDRELAGRRRRRGHEHGACRHRAPAESASRSLGPCCGRPSAGRGVRSLEMLSIVEIDSDNRLSAGISFDIDDIDAAFEELDARYLAGEAAAHAHTWSLITRAYAAIQSR